MSRCCPYVRKTISLLREQINLPLYRQRITNRLWICIVELALNYKPDLAVRLLAVPRSRRRDTFRLERVAIKALVQTVLDAIRSSSNATRKSDSE